MYSVEDIIYSLNEKNTWWKNGKVDAAKLFNFKRNEYYLAEKSFNSELRRIVVLCGTRRVGKSSIMYQMIDELLNSGIEPRKILYFSMDMVSCKEFGIDKVIRIYNENIYEGKDFYLFIDEVQNDENWTLKLKDIYDTYNLVKCVATGSSSPKIAKKIKEEQESGAGRWTVINVPTLSFYEYCEIKGIKKDIGDIDVFSFHKLSKSDQTSIVMKLSDLNVHLLKYLDIGGFPEFVNVKDVDEAKNSLREQILSKVIWHDMVETYNIRNPKVLEKFYKYLCLNSSNVLNIETVCKELENVSRPTIEKYIEDLADSSLIYICPLLSKGGKSPLKEKNKIHIADTGIRSVFVPRLNVYTNSTELGYQIETATFKHIRDYYNRIRSFLEIGYIKDKNGKEIDIVISDENVPIQLVEAKARNNSVIKDDDGIIVYGIKDIPGYVITKDSMDYGLTERKGTSLYRIPAVVFLYLIGKMR